MKEFDVTITEKLQAVVTVQAETAQEAAEAAAQEAIETVVAAQGPGICYVDSDGIPYVLE